MLKQIAISSALVVFGGLFAATAGADPKSGATGSEYGTDKQSTAKHDEHGMQKQGLTFSELDQNGDGTISESELQQADAEIAVDHSSLDMDADGQVDRAEFAAFERKQRDPSRTTTPGTEPGETSQSDDSGSDRDY